MFNPYKLDEKLLPIEHKFEDNFEPLPECLMTSIYSKADGTVQWKVSLLPQGKLTQNIQVDCSHCGMATAPAVIYLLTRLFINHSYCLSCSIWFLRFYSVGLIHLLQIFEIFQKE